MMGMQGNKLRGMSPLSFIPRNNDKLKKENCAEFVLCVLWLSSQGQKTPMQYPSQMCLQI